MSTFIPINETDIYIYIYINEHEMEIFFKWNFWRINDLICLSKSLPISLLELLPLLPLTSNHCEW